MNVLRLSLHPQGLAPRIVNLGQWREHLFERLRQQVQATGDAGLAALLRRTARLPGARRRPTAPGCRASTWASRCRCSCAPPTARVLSFISTTTVFGTAVDVTVQELTLETFFPADAATAQALQRLAATPA